MPQGRFKNPVEAVLTGIKDFAGRKSNVRPLNEHDRLDGKYCMVTGANSGVGFAIAVEFASRGANLIMACRSGIPEAGEKVKAFSGSEKVEMLFVDLSDIDSIHALADQLKAKQIELDIVVCNAGVATPKARKTKQGFDEIFMVNYLSKFILLNRLLYDGVIPNAKYGKNSRMGETKPRIIFTSSDSHRNASAIDFDELGIFKPYGVNGSISRYSYYKLVLNTFATELSRRLNPHGNIDVSVHAACPGPVNTNIIRDAGPLLKVFLKFIFRFFFQSPEKAAPPLVYLAAAKELEGKTNLYLHMMTHRRMDEKVYEEEAGRRLWERSEEILKGVDAGR